MIQVDDLKEVVWRWVVPALVLVVGLSEALANKNGESGVKMVSRFRPDIVLMDIRMPIMDGIEATKRLKAASESPQVIVLTTFDADDLVY
jgi:DNA-binding NarL/FixJ family response regulator